MQDLDLEFATTQERTLWALAHYGQITDLVPNLGEVSEDVYLGIYVRIARRAADNWDPDTLHFTGWLVASLQNEIAQNVRRGQTLTTAEKAEAIIAEAEQAWAQLETNSAGGE